MPAKSDFPGLQRRYRKDGSIALYWVAYAYAIAAGYRTKTVRLHYLEGSPELKQRCQDLDAQMKAWFANGERVDRPIRFDGTIHGLIAQYKNHDLSPYQDFPANSRKTADKESRAIDRAVGERRLEYLHGIDFRRWYREFSRARWVARSGSPALTSS
jgi:hypothetical protein